MRAHPGAEPGRMSRGVTGAVELARAERLERIEPRKQLAARAALPPPGAQQLQQSWREHGMAVLAPLAHLHPDQHALRIDVADPRHHHLAAAQAGAIGDAEGGLVFEPGTRRCLQQMQHIVRRQNARQLARILRAPDDG
jgi:hypothetical protein